MKDLKLEELLELTKGALDKANRDLGFVKPIEEGRRPKIQGFVPAPYDPEKDIKLVDFNPKEWGIKGTPSANQIDAILENILFDVQDTNPLTKVKTSFKKIKEVLGPEMTSTGLPLKSKTGTSSIHERFALLQLKAAFYTIFHGYQAAQSGKIFESLIARIVGGYQSDRDDSRIEDLRDDQGNFISLKAIDRKTSVEGSIKNLALGIIEADKIKKGNGVKYLVCVKDIESSPLYFKAFSFLINKENYFNFILNEPNVSVEDIQRESAKILKTTLTEARTAAEKGTDIEINQEKLRDAASIYAKKYLAWDESKPHLSRFMHDYFDNLYNIAVNRAKQLIVDIQIGDESRKVSLYDIFVLPVKKHEGMFPVMKELGGLFKELPPESKKNYFVDFGIYMTLKEEFPRLNVNVANLGKYLDFDEKLRSLYHDMELKKSFTYEKEKELTNILKTNSQRYKNIYKTFIEDPAVTEFIKFLDQYIKTVDEYRYSVRKPEVGIAAGKQFTAIDNPIEDFFKKLEDQETLRQQKSDISKEEEYDKTRETWKTKREKYIGNLEEGVLLEAPAISTTFSLTINQTLSLAAAVGAELDQDYETVVIDTGYLFETGTDEEQKVKKELEGLFRSHHETRQRYIQWFGYRDPEGLTLAAKSLETESELIGNMRKEALSPEQSQPSTTSAGPAVQAELKKNNKQVLTDDDVMDILKKIL